VKGAFTGAVRDNKGLFLTANRGTLFLDEIGDMPLAMQAKLLRVLEEGEVERIGADKPTTVDVRVVVATHRNLEQLVESNTFRRDLYHRVVVFPVELPPLRKRCEDLPTLVDHFARQVSGQNGWKPVPFSPSAIESLKEYGWPGNIRELRNVVERLLLLATGEEVNLETVRAALPQGSEAPTAVGSGPLVDRVQSFEREVILAELKRNRYHITNTAKALDLERSHLYKKAEQLGIDVQALRHQSPDDGSGEN
jgi:DNA-binding NtrC family response regulator